MPPLKDDKEDVTEGKGLKDLNSKQTITKTFSNISTIEDKKLAITKHKTFPFNLHRDIENNFKDKIDYIKIYYELLADQKLKN